MNDDDRKELNLIDLLNADNLIDTDDPVDNFLSYSDYFDDENFSSKLKSFNGNISILSMNICSLPAKFDKILLYLELLKSKQCFPSIICFQETALSEDDDLSLFNIPNYKLFSSGKSASAKGGLVTYVHQSLKSSRIDVPHLDEIWEGLFVEIVDLHGKKFIIGNIYRPPRYSEQLWMSFINNFSECFKKLDRKNREFVVVGDFNIDLLKIDNNKMSATFFNTICSLSLLPRITHPTRIARTSQTLIDNALCKLSCDISDVEAGILTHQFSDHNPYFLILKAFHRNNPTPSVTKYRQYSHKNLNTFQQLFQSNNLSNISLSSNNDDPNQTYEILHENIQQNFESAFPLITKKFDKYKDKKNPWMTDELLHLIKQRDKLLKKKKKAKSKKRKDNIWTELRDLNSTIDKKISQAKNSHFHDQFNKCKSDIKKTWSLINKILNRTSTNDYPDFFLDTDGNKLTDYKHIADGLNNFFSNVGPELSSSIKPGPKEAADYFDTITDIPSFTLHGVSVDDVTKAITDLKTKSSSGFDNISTKVLQHIKSDIAPYLTKIANQVISTGIFPDKLKVAKVTALHKKGDKSKFSNYRPISLLPSISKVIERIIHDQMYEFFENNNLFFENQYGYRKNHSTEFAALQLVEQILSRMDKGFDTYAIFMDLSKAFDTIDHNILLMKLRKYNFSNLAIHLIKNYLSDRYQFVEYREISSSLSKITTGVPQGSILGPLLFLIYINDLRYASEMFNTITYADDTTLTYSPNFTFDEKHTSNQINIELQNIHDWFAANKLSLNVEKTNFMIFHSKGTKPLNLKLEINSSLLTKVSSFKFLGILLQENLKWNNHVNQVTIKISRAVGVLNRLKYILPKSVLLTIYHSLISCYFNNNLLLWGHDLDTVFKLQKRAIRIVCGKHHLAHTAPLFKTLNILQLPDIFSLSILKFYYKFENQQLPLSLLKLKIRKNSSFHSYNTRNRHKLSTPTFRHSFFCKSILYTVAHFVNSLNTDIKDKIRTHSLSNIISRYKIQTISNYQVTCQIYHCYICLKN